MNKNIKSHVSFAIFIILLLIDFVSKREALALTEMHTVLGFIQLGVREWVEGFLSLSSNSSPIQVIHYATFLGPLLLIYFYLLSQMSKKAVYLNFQPWLTFWVAGLVGIVVDRMIYGDVILWLEVGPIRLSVATLMVWIGLFGCAFQAYRYREDVFQFYWKRKLRFINPTFQSFYILNVIGVSLFLAISLLIFSYTFMKYYVFEFGVLIPRALIHVFVLEFLLIMGVFMVILVFMGYLYSSKIAGPLHAFGLFLEKLQQGKNATFKLREDDDLKELESMAQTIKAHWNKPLGAPDDAMETNDSDDASEE